MGSKSPHPPFGHLLPCEDAREKAHFICLLPSPDLIRGWEKVADRPDEGPLLAICDSPACRARWRAAPEGVSGIASPPRLLRAAYFFRNNGARSYACNNAGLNGRPIE